MKEYSGKTTIKRYGEDFVFVNRKELEWLEEDREKYFKLQQLNAEMLEEFKYIVERYQSSEFTIADLKICKYKSIIGKAEEIK